MAQGAEGTPQLAELAKIFATVGGEGKDGGVSHHPTRSALWFQTWDPEHSRLF